MFRTFVAIEKEAQQIEHHNKNMSKLLFSVIMNYLYYQFIHYAFVVYGICAAVVCRQVLHKISELQTHQPAQFEELGLPLAIKRLAWEKDAKLFVKVVTPHAEKYIASEYAPKMILASQQVREREREREENRSSQFGRRALC